MTTNFNPGEPVFDQETGEPYIDASGNLTEVSPGLKVDGASGRTLDGDDVANAAFYRGNKFLGETLRAVNIGVPFQNVLGQTDKAQAMTVVLAEVRQRTPGVVGIVSARVTSYNPQTRVLVWRASLIRGDGTTQAIASSTTG
jgi:hypothetical protein